MKNIESISQLTFGGEEEIQSTTGDKEKTAIMRLRTASEMSLSIYEKPLIITTSGGKDSDICLHLAKIAGIPYEVAHNHTTADAPQTIYHIRKQFYALECDGVKCTINQPTYKGKHVSMWSLIPQKLMPPTRLGRYCCEVLKEQGGKDRMITTGVRWSESANRKNNRGIYENGRKIILNSDNDDRRRIFENCKMKAKRICNPIVDWTDRDVWDYINFEKIPMNPLYGMGFDRVGCIGCPMASNKRYMQFRIFPEYETMYRKAFARTAEARKLAGKINEGLWETADGMFAWWMQEDINQITIDQYMELQMDEHRGHKL